MRAQPAPSSAATARSCTSQAPLRIVNRHSRERFESCATLGQAAAVGVLGRRAPIAPASRGAPCATGDTPSPGRKVSLPTGQGIDQKQTNEVTNPKWFGIPLARSV